MVRCYKLVCDWPRQPLSAELSVEDRRNAAVAVCEPLCGGLMDMGQQIGVTGVGSRPARPGTADHPVVHR